VRQFDGFSLVTVFSGSASAAGQSLLAGHQAFRRGGWQAIAPLEPNRAACGRHAGGVADALSDFVAELSRYRLGQLGCSERVADL
jgi:transmembrane sensor